MSDGPYDHKPKTKGDPGDWYEISFRISADVPVDWDNVDLSVWAGSVCRYTVLKMAASALTEAQVREMTEPISSILLALKVERLEFVTDELLHELIDKEETDD